MTYNSYFHEFARKFLGISALAAAVLLTSCSSPQSIASSAPPGSSIISFPSSYDRTLTTIISSAPSDVQAGVTGSALAVNLFDQQQPRETLMALDDNGNLGIEGAIYVRSSRFEKTDIKQYRKDALGLLDKVQIVTFRYDNESGPPEHIGFIAQDAPGALTNPNHDAMNVTNTVSVELAATQQLAMEVARLKRQVKILKDAVSRAEIAQPRRHR